ncbi:PREDICTED: uncharacterized protein LOC109330953 [Lupinus angustifolius]|uniref:uncharacterized protein LOC109330953 n=1 Tax=Lupinus angustifolius TaxID=3871 RepID=UPI00092F40B4|nr:PREDICTED: uncharacterized protein LOC109330953 [Lupinus angustifolius]
MSGQQTNFPKNSKERKQLPLMKVLRLMDSEKKATMDYIYEVMDKPKEAIIKAFYEKEKKYKDVFKIINEGEIEMQIYKDANGMFGSSTTIAMRTEMTPVVQWRMFGAPAPNLQPLAIRILSLTCSALGCECNWSVFEQIHTKKRNKLDIKRMYDVVYVKYNQALKQRFNVMDEVDPISLNDIDECNEWLVEEMDSDDEGGNESVFKDDDDLE